jgi:hypothetical protein
MGFVNITLDVLKVDERKAQQKYDIAIRRQMNNAARAFVRAAVKRIPVDTGMARGSLLHLGRLLRVAVPIRPKPSIRERNYQYEPARGQPKTAALGSELTVSHITKKGSRYEFIFHTQIFHLILNDVWGSAHTGPWNALSAGRQEAQRYMRGTAPKRMPHPTEYLLKSRHSIGRGGRLFKEKFKPVRKQKTVRS